MIEDALVQISKNLKEISATLKKISKTNNARLELEKETVRESKKGMKEALKIRDMVLGKGEEFQKDVLEMLGIPEKVDLENIELGDDINK